MVNTIENSGAGMSGNDGFIEPPSWMTPPERPEPKPANDEEPPDDVVITLPPGISNSATVRLPPERQRASPPKPEIVFFPTAPGAAPAAPHPAAPPAGLMDSTVHVSRPTRAWRLVFDGSPPVVVGDVLFLGRNPIPTASHEGAPVLAVTDSTKSVSKTHAMLEVDADELWVHDLDSTNGVWVVPQGVDAIEVTPGQRVAVPAGADLELGDFVIQVERG